MRLGADPELVAMHKDVYMPMIGPPKWSARRYGIGRERQDEYALQSQQRTAAAQAAGKFDDEIVPVTATMAVKDKETGEVSQHEVTITKDEGNRADTTLEGLRSLQPVLGPDGIDHRRQCQPAVRRRLGLRDDGAGSPRERGLEAARPLCRHGGRPAPSPTKWASARSSRCPSCSSGSASRSTTSACGS